MKINGKKYWSFDCIDPHTRFLLASHISPNRGPREARTFTGKVADHANRTPKLQATDKLAAYLDGIELAFAADVKHRQGRLFEIENNTGLFERFQGSFKDRTKASRGLKTPETAKKSVEGCFIHHTTLH